MKLRTLYFTLFVGMVTANASAQVVPDGNTATTVSTDAAGHVTVGIAPVFGGGVTGDVSHNSYRDFNVLKPGVSLDNRMADARTIVNEVTSSNPSLITGKLEVLGSQAHVILANPNGITVNGGRFVNTGGVALTTGKVSYIDRQITPITLQRNTVLTTNKGTITIEGEGLSGIFSNLEILAKRIKVDAPIVNEQTDTGARIRLVGGDSSTELDSSISPVDITNHWSELTPGNATVSEDDCSKAVCVNITGAGSLTSGKLEVVVTDEGAGVKMAGNMAAMSDFVLAANGEVKVHGDGKITAGQDSTISSTKKVIITDEAQVKAGGVNLLASDDQVRLEKDALVSGSNMLVQGDGRLTLQASEENEKWRSPQLVAVDGSIELTPGSLIELNGGDIFAGQHVITNSSYLYMNALQDSKGVWHQPSITAANGGLLVQTTRGGVINNGGLLQGNTRIVGNSDSLGAVTVVSAAPIENTSLAKDALAILFGINDDTVVHAQGNITNNTGRFISNKSVDVLAQNGKFSNIIDKAVLPNEGEVIETKRKNGSFLFMKKSVKTTSVAFGDARILGESAVITAGENVNIEANEVDNTGGDIFAQGGTLTVRAHHLKTEMLLGGSTFAQVKCSLFCKAKGGSTLATYGGNMQAQGNVDLQVGRIENIGGTVMSLEGDVITHGATVLAKSIPAYELLKMDRGMFHDDFIRLLRYDQGGSFIANRGKLSIHALSPVTVDGGTLTGVTLDIQPGTNIVREPVQKPVVRSGGGIGIL